MTKTLLHILLLLSSVNLFAQHPEVIEDQKTDNNQDYSQVEYYEPADRYFMFSFGYSQVSPLGEFRKNTSSIFNGVSSSATWFIDRQNVAVGFFWNFHTYDPYKNIGGNKSDNIVYGFDQLMTNVKFITNDGFLQPYMEAFIGLNWLYIDEHSHLTSILLGAIDEELDRESENTSIADAASLAYGIGGGILIPLDFKNPNGRGAYIELGVRYAFSTETNYLSRSSSYDYESSNTNNFTFSFGFVVIL